MDTQPEALRLADALEVDKWHISAVTAQSAADELRRLHAVEADFHMAYRMKCDAQTKVLHAQGDALRADAERYRYLLGHARRIDVAGWSISHMEQLSARIDKAREVQ